MEIILRDLRYGFRMLLKHPASRWSRLCTSVGIGANTAIVSVVNAGASAPAAICRTSRLVNLWESHIQRGINQGAVLIRLADWRDQSQVFEGRRRIIKATSFDGVDEPARLEGAVVNADLFDYWERRRSWSNIPRRRGQAR